MIYSNGVNGRIRPISIYFITLLEKNKSDPKSFWKFLHELLPSKTRCGVNSIRVPIEAVSLTDSSAIAESFNDFFTNIVDLISTVSTNSSLMSDQSLLHNFIEDKVPQYQLFYYRAYIH